MQDKNRPTFPELLEPRILHIYPIYNKHHLIISLPSAKTFVGKSKLYDLKFLSQGVKFVAFTRGLNSSILTKCVDWNMIVSQLIHCIIAECCHCSMPFYA